MALVLVAVVCSPLAVKVACPSLVALLTGALLAGAGELSSATGTSEMVCSTSMSLMACKLAASNGLKLSPSNSLRLSSPRGLSTFNLSLPPPFPPPSFTPSLDTLVVVSVLAVLMTGAAGVGVRIAEPGEGISGGGSWAELVALACSAAAASLLLRSSASCCSLLSLA